MSDNLIKTIMVFMTENYGCDIRQRMAKLKEEVGELEEALNRYHDDNRAVDDVLNEVADVLLVLLHIAWLVLPFSCSIFSTALTMICCSAFRRMTMRMTDKDYQRTHPHKVNVEAGEKY